MEHPPAPSMWRTHAITSIYAHIHGPVVKPLTFDHPADRSVHPSPGYHYRLGHGLIAPVDTPSQHIRPSRSLTYSESRKGFAPVTMKPTRTVCRSITKQ